MFVLWICGGSLFRICLYCCMVHVVGRLRVAIVGLSRVGLFSCECMCLDCLLLCVWCLFVGSV